jgi:hypothetical protein
MKTLYDCFIESGQKKVFVELDFHKDKFVDEMGEYLGIDLNDGTWFHLLGFGSSKDTSQADYDIVFEAEEISFSSAVCGRSKIFLDYFATTFCEKELVGRKIYSLNCHLIDMISRYHTSDKVIEDFLTVCDKNEVYMYGGYNKPPIRLNREYLAEIKKEKPLF